MNLFDTVSQKKEVISEKLEEELNNIEESKIEEKNQEISKLPKNFSIIYHEKKERKVRKFETKKEALEFKEEIKDKYKRIAFIEKGKVYPVDYDEDLSEGGWWCPYEGKWRNFKMDHRKGVRLCTHCGISDSDYYVKRENGKFSVGGRR